MRHHSKGRMERASAATFPQEEREATVKAIRTVVRRLGVVLGAAHTAAESELLRGGLIDTATVLRDALKPVIDELVHFELEDLDGTPED